LADTKGRVVLSDLSRGRNGFTPPWAIAANECADAVNVDYYGTKFARKCGGAANQSALTGATTAGIYSSLGRHVPGTDPTVAELWATDDSATPIVNRLAGGTAWSAPTLKDAPTGNGWDFSYASINGKFFLGYQSGQPRMHCWDGSTVRRAGIVAPAVPTAIDTGSGTGVATIAFDATATGTAGAATTVTFAHTCAATATAMIVMASTNVTNGVIGVTYNGVAFARLGTPLQNPVTLVWGSIWFQANPSSGAHNVVVTSSVPLNITGHSVSYTGARSTSLDAFSAGTTQTLSLTTLTDNSWALIAQLSDGGAVAAGAGTTQRQSGANGAFLGDSNAAITPPGLTTLATAGGTTWTGFIISIAPSPATFYASATRTYRIRWTRQTAGITLGRSEPGTSVAFTSSGSGIGVLITEPAAANESETHWEVEGSVDGVTFYRIATVPIGTTTYTDSAAPSTYSTNPLSALTGTYTLLPAAKFIAADQGRLLTFGSYTTTDKQNDIIVSAVIGSLDVSDEERVDTNTNYRIGLDEKDSGVPTGLIGPVNNSYIAFKDRQSWLLTATGTTAQPYRQDVLSKTVGAVSPNAMDRGEDSTGNACIYWMSHRGPYRWGKNGMEYIGKGVEDFVLTTLFFHGSPSQPTLNLMASNVVSVVRYFADLRQVWFWWATAASPDPNQLFKFDIISEGWTRVPSTDGPANARCAVAFSETIGATMSRRQKVYLGQTGGNNRLWKMETGTDYAGTTYQGYVLTGAIEPGGPGFVGEVGDAQLLAKAADSVTITDIVTGDFGAAGTKTGTASLTPVGSETRVRPVLMETGFNDVGFVQHQIGDAIPTANTWTLERLVIPVEKHRAASA
jgi:hypothetical protein